MEPKPAKTKVPKENSYYYWMDDKNKPKNGQNANMNAPKKISVTQAEQLNQSNLSSNQSAWNTLGTWEERTFKVADFKSFIHKQPGTPKEPSGQTFTCATFRLRNVLEPE